MHMTVGCFDLAGKHHSLPAIKLWLPKGMGLAGLRAYGIVHTFLRNVTTRFLGIWDYRPLSDFRRRRPKLLLYCQSI